MCGIFGQFSFSQSPLDPKLIAEVAKTIKHRGPDAFGVYSDDLVMLGNQRLSILDLSDKSNQPMSSDDGNVVVVQNGEIYNFIEIREQLKLKGQKFYSGGDTEVILRAYEFWGLDFIKHLNGMFAIAIYDKRRTALYLYRDRLGVKPLFYTDEPRNGRIWFASEIKAILKNGLNYRPSVDSIAQYFALNYVPQPSTIFDGIRHVPPGHMLQIDLHTGVKLQKYWDLSETQPVEGMSEAEAKIGIIKHLDDATHIRMRSDAPFGAFLSGGIDSSSVVAFMSMYHPEQLKTFSIGFEDQRFDESYFARLASNRFGTDHTIEVCDASSSKKWDEFIYFCDQPHGDVSFIPMLQVSELAASQVKMVMTGDGGDEIFAGYDKYKKFFEHNNPESLEGEWERRYAEFTGLLNYDQAKGLISGELRDAFFETNPYRAITNQILMAPFQDPINRVLFADVTTLLPGNNLVKPDRMGMANSLEIRSPLLDYRLVEFSFQIPGRLKLVNGETKWIYKKATEVLLGSELTWRKKQMFTVPVGEWLRQRLAGYCRDVLLDGRLGSRGMFNIEYLEKMIQAHVQGSANFTRELRAIISLELWFRIFVDRDGSS